LPDAEDFYDPVPPDFFQQGDILDDVPLVGLPPGPDLLVLREELDFSRPAVLKDSILAAFWESEVDAFGDNSSEYIVAKAVRGPALLVTQTCNLVQEVEWLVAPIYPVVGSAVKLKELFDDKYENLFGLPAHPQDIFPNAFAVLSDLKPIHKDSVELDDRAASLLSFNQLRLADKITRALAREWGYAAGEKVLTTGQYRCLRCNRCFNIENPVRDFTQGDSFPDCDNCKKIRKTAQWYLLHQHRKH
jgi:hypothetical protein